MPKIALPNQTAKYWHYLVNFSAPRTRIIFPFALLESWFQDATFQYHKPYLTNILNFDLKGGNEFFQAAPLVGKKGQILFLTIFLVLKYIKTPTFAMAVNLKSLFHLKPRPKCIPLQLQLVKVNYGLDWSLTIVNETFLPAIWWNLENFYQIFSPHSNFSEFENIIFK